MAPPKTIPPSAGSAESPTTKTAPASSPIDVLQNPLARTYTHLHVAIIISTFVYSFQSIVADPVTSLLGLLPPIALLQGLYFVICLPSTNVSSSSTASSKKKKSAQDGTDIGSKIVPAIISLLLTLTLSTPLLYLALILFGAPLTSHPTHTLLAAAHLALLASPGLFYAHGVNATAWRKVLSLDLPVDEVFGAALGTALGAWAGAVPIPLDWDREWQRWPVTVVAGAYGGWALGKVVGGTLGRGVRVKLD